MFSFPETDHSLSQHGLHIVTHILKASAAELTRQQRKALQVCCVTVGSLLLLLFVFNSEK